MYDNFVRDLVAKSLGENQAKELDVRPFEHRTPDAILAIYDVSRT